MTRHDRHESNDHAVSDIVGSMLLVGITVTVMAGVAVLILSIDGPEDPDRADLGLTAGPGAAGWGTGDETITIAHRGGESIAASGVTVILSINGIATERPATSLGGVWSDGTLSIGESWTSVRSLDADDEVKLQIRQDGSSSRLLAAAVLRTGTGLDCSSDSTPPDVATWIQAPVDVTETTSGNLSLTAVVFDDCSGTDDSTPPSLRSRLDGGNWTDHGPMTDIGVGRWTGTIPDPTWAAHAGELLEMQVTGLFDLAGNHGDSSLHSDLIELLNGVTYPDASIIDLGSLDSLAALQDVGGPVATFNESVAQINRSASTVSDVGIPDALNAVGAADDSWATVADHLDELRLSGFDTTGLSGAIGTVEVVFEANRILVPSNDDLSIGYRVGGGTFDVILSDYVPAARGLFPLFPYDEEVAIDVTTDRTWTWQDIADTEVLIEYEKTGSPDAVAFYIDAAWIRVTPPGTPDSLDATLQFPDLPLTSDGELEIQYQVIDDTFDVQVWDGTWTTRGTLSSSTMTLFTYTLTEDERTVAGGPQIRFLDTTPGATPGSLLVDYARVVNG